MAGLLPGTSRAMLGEFDPYGGGLDDMNLMGADWLNTAMQIQYYGASPLGPQMGTRQAISPAVGNNIFIQHQLWNQFVDNPMAFSEYNPNGGAGMAGGYGGGFGGAGGMPAVGAAALGNPYGGIGLGQAGLGQAGLGGLGGLGGGFAGSAGGLPGLGF